MKKLENLKKSIETILDQFPKVLKSYDNEAQVLITNFLELFSDIGKAEHDRGNISNQFAEYRDQIFNHQHYYTTQFLWLTKRIAEESVYHLNISRFYPLEFYTFILTQFRPIFQAIRQKERLDSSVFDELQNSIKSLYSPLTADELELLIRIQLISNMGGIDALSPSQIRNEILTISTISSRLKREAEFTRLLALVEGIWWLRFHSPAFGLQRVFFRLTLRDKISFESLVDCSNPANTTLGRSDIYKIGGGKSDILGTFLIPSTDIDSLERLFRYYEREEKVQIAKFVPISLRKRLVSFSNYKANLGWQKLTQKVEKKISRTLKSSSVLKSSSDDLKSLLDPLIVPQWNIRDLDSPVKYVEEYCRISTVFSYENLPDLTTKRSSLSHSQIAVLSQLCKKHIVEVGFLPWRLVDEFSRNLFCVEIPPIRLSALLPFLEYLPYVEGYFSEQNHFLLTRLSSQMVQWIKSSLGWNVFNIQHLHQVTELKSSWFIPERTEWLKPRVLMG